jgi:hypothetical protein
MDKNTELRSSLLYFVDEAIGFRKSIHHFHRWVESRSQDDLEALVIEIGFEQFVDLRALVSAIGINDKVRIASALDNMNLYGFFKSSEDLSKIKSMLDADTSIKTLINFLNFYISDPTLLLCVADDDIILLGNVLGFYYPTNKKYISQLALTVCKYPDLNWKDALSRNQIKSKKWLLAKLSNYLTSSKRGNIFASKSETPTMLVVGGWVGMLPFLASMQGMKLGKVVNIDIDTTVHEAATSLNSQFIPLFSNLDKDIRLVDFFAYNNPLIIDTIVEHFKNHDRWVKSLPAGTEVVLQGNNMFDVIDHVNCHASLIEFVKNSGLAKIKWQGELVLHKCNRYMAIGTV